MKTFQELADETKLGVDPKWLEDINKQQELTIRLYARFNHVRSLLYNDQRPMTQLCFLRFDHLRNQITWYTARFLEADPSWRAVMDLSLLMRSDESLLNEVHAEALAYETERNEQLATAGAQLPVDEEKAMEHMQLLFAAFERKYPSHYFKLVRKLSKGL